MNDKSLPIEIPVPVRELPVEGRNLREGPFGAQLGDPGLLVFLRHLG